MIQFDEPAFNVYLDEAADWGVQALERAAQGLTCKTAVHICYGYGIQANIALEEHARRGVAPVREDRSRRWRPSRIDQVSLECIHSHVPPELMALLKGKDVMVGVIDVASDEIETPEEVADTIGRALQFVPPRPADRLHQLRPGADGAAHVAEAKLQALAAGAALARERYAKA